MALPEIYTLSLHDALPILSLPRRRCPTSREQPPVRPKLRGDPIVEVSIITFDTQFRAHRRLRSEEHTSELQSLRHLVCRLLLEKKKQKNSPTGPTAPLNAV